MGFESDNPKVRKAAAIAAEKSDQRRGTLDDQVRSALADTLPADGEGILTPEPSGGDQSSNQAAAATSPIQVLPDAEVARQEKASAKASRLSQGADDGGLMDLISSYSALPRNLAANAFKSSPSKTERGLGEKDSKQSTPTVVGKGPKSK